MEQWIANNWYYIGAVFVFAVLGYAAIYDMKGDLREHLDPKNPSPHPSCPVHTAKFDGITTTLDKIDKRLEKIDNRIFAFMRSNGFHHEGDDK